MNTWVSEALNELSGNPVLQGTLAALATLLLEDPTLVACAFLVADEKMFYLTALVGLSVGIGIGDWGLYGLGRFVGPKTVRWGLVSRARLEHMGNWFERNLVVAIFVSRFVPGLRLPANLAAGMSRLALIRYLPVAMVASLLWTFVALSAIAKLGEVLMPLLGRLRWPAVIALIVWIMYMQRRSYKAMSADEVRRESDESAASFFEFWHPIVFYAPVSLYYLWLAIRHRSLTLPTVANPSIYAGGMILESKTAILDLVPASMRTWIAPYVRFVRPSATVPLDAIVRDAEKALDTAGLELPIVAKPDIGQRGAGVRPIYNQSALRQYLADFPSNAAICLQELVPYRNEVGVMYHRAPHEDRGHFVSVTAKEFLTITGDGEHTLRGLIEKHDRAYFLKELFFKRHDNELDRVLAAGEEFPLVFAGNHAQGCIFRDALHLLTPDLTQLLDELAQSIPEFYFGRFDIRYRDLESFQRGENFGIVEINGAGAEATHIWDPEASLKGAYATLFAQFRTLFEIAAENRERGHTPVGPVRFLKDVVLYHRLARKYPMAH